MSLFNFQMRVVDRDKDPYFVTRWDRATPVTVQAASRAEAFRECFTLMGAPPRYRMWLARIDRIEPARPVPAVSAAQPEE